MERIRRGIGTAAIAAGLLASGRPASARTATEPPATASPVAASPRPCARLRPVGKVSPSGHEARILRRIDEAVVADGRATPDLPAIVAVFDDCLALLREGPSEGDADSSEASADAERARWRRGVGQLQRLSLRAKAAGILVRGEVESDPEKEPAERSNRGGADKGGVFEVSARGAPSAVAERVTKRALEGLGATRDPELRNALWFLWIESYLKALGGRFNMYDYADERLATEALRIGKTFSLGFHPRFEADGRLVIVDVADARLTEQDFRAGDEVVSLDDRAIDAIDPARLQHYWLSPQPFAYTVAARREGVTRRARAESVARRLETMEWALRDTKAYLRIRRFAEQSLIELRRALREIERAGASGLVVDLRHDPGGASSPGVVDCFLKPGAKIMTFRDMKAGSKTEDIEATVEYHDLPLAVLVDGETASMAEVFAAAIQVNGRGRIVGQRTFGKGVGQSRHEIEDEGILWLVDRDYFYPGTPRSWNETGIQPDVLVDIDAGERSRVAEWLEEPVIDLAKQWPDDTALRKAFETLEKAP